MNEKRRAAIGALLARDRAPGRPRAALEHARQRKLLSADAKPFAHQRRDAIQQRHRKRTPRDDEADRDIVRARQRRGSRGVSTPMSTNKPPLRYSAKPVRPSISVTRTPGALKRFDQRIGEPLRELVQRHVTRTTACGQQSPRETPSRLGRFSQIGPSASSTASRMTGAANVSPRRPRAQRIVQSAGPRYVAQCEQGTAAHRSSDPGDSANARGPPGQSAGCARSPGTRRRARPHRICASASASARNGSSGSAEKPPHSNSRKLASANPSERCATISVIWSW